jgi:hypothetical protein
MILVGVEGDHQEDEEPLHHDVVRETSLPLEPSHELLYMIFCFTAFTATPIVNVACTKGEGGFAKYCTVSANRMSYRKVMNAAIELDMDVSSLWGFEG